MKLSATLPHSQNTFNDWLSELGGEDEWDAACADCGCTACKCGTYLSAFVRKKPPLAVRRKSEKNRRAWIAPGEQKKCTLTAAGCAEDATDCCRRCGNRVCAEHGSIPMPCVDYRDAQPCCERCFRSFLATRALLVVGPGSPDKDAAAACLLLRRYARLRYPLVSVVAQPCAPGSTAEPADALGVQTFAPNCDFKAEIPAAQRLTWAEGCCFVHLGLQKLFPDGGRLGNAAGQSAVLGIKIVSGRKASQVASARLLKDVLELEFEGTVSCVLDTAGPMACPACGDAVGVLADIGGSCLLCHSCGRSFDTNQHQQGAPKPKHVDSYFAVMVKSAGRYNLLLPTGPLDTPHRLALLYFNIAKAELHADPVTV
ncbi:hypothetical protein DIPPA_04110 [Diplonema papillatum]|nr:hypothetical protein DIPPA_04110 [Diplonema papillatum]